MNNEDNLCLIELDGQCIEEYHCAKWESIADGFRKAKLYTWSGQKSQQLLKKDDTKMP